MFHIIDDEKDLCELIVEFLKSAGYEAIAYSNPVEYLNYVYNDSYVAPIAIITDVLMPEMNGYELIDKVKVKFPEQKFVVTSGYDGEAKAFRKTSCHFLPKPFSPEELIAIVDAIEKCEKECPLLAVTEHSENE